MYAVRQSRTRLVSLAGSLALVGVAGSLVLPPLTAQQIQSVAPPALPAQPGATPRSFEVASVKQNTANDNRVMIGMQPGGRYTATGVPLRLIIRNAFRVQDSQLVGLPDWTRSERFDITAKADVPSPTPEMMNEMMQSLLAERFSFAAHRETREMPVYELILARADGRLGPGLKASTVDCEAMRGRGRGAPPEGGRVTMPLGRGAGSGTGPGAGAGIGGGGRGLAGPLPPCSTRMMPGNVTANGSTLDQLATLLETQAGRIVRNKTGLSGAYDFSLTFTPEQLAGGGGGGGGRGVDAPAADPGAAPSLFTAVQEQLGLKLDSQRAPVDVIVVDRVERPTPD
jgi:uncharacterized protein (TIGR03435 family)